jgi:hypothetical protein
MGPEPALEPRCTLTTGCVGAPGRSRLPTTRVTATIAVLAVGSLLLKSAAAHDFGAITRSHLRGAASPELIVVRRDGAAPHACPQRSVARRLVRLGVALDAGDRTMMANLLDPPRRFEWISEQALGRLLYSVRTVPSAIDALMSRHKQHEHWRFTSVSVAYNQRGTVAHVAFAMGVAADDIDPARDRPLRLAVGKGAIECGSLRIRLLSIAISRRARTVGDDRICDRRARRGTVWVC